MEQETDDRQPEPSEGDVPHGVAELALSERLLLGDSRDARDANDESAADDLELGGVEGDVVRGDVGAVAICAEGVVPLLEMELGTGGEDGVVLVTVAADEVDVAVRCIVGTVALLGMRALPEIGSPRRVWLPKHCWSSRYGNGRR